MGLYPFNPNIQMGGVKTYPNQVGSWIWIKIATPSSAIWVVTKKFK